MRRTRGAEEVGLCALEMKERGVRVSERVIGNVE